MKCTAERQAAKRQIARHIVRAPDDILERLAARAGAEGKARTEIVRDAIRTWAHTECLRLPEGTPTRSARPSNRPGTTFIVRVPASWWVEIEKAAKHRRVTACETIRTIVADFLDVDYEPTLRSTASTDSDPRHDGAVRGGRVGRPRHGPPAVGEIRSLTLGERHWCGAHDVRRPRTLRIASEADCTLRLYRVVPLGEGHGLSSAAGLFDGDEASTALDALHRYWNYTDRPLATTRPSTSTSVTTRPTTQKPATPTSTLVSAAR